jgi:hypothetical protein
MSLSLFAGVSSYDCLTQLFIGFYSRNGNGSFPDYSSQAAKTTGIQEK